MTIKVGGNFVTIGSAGVSIKGATVAIKADGIVSIDGSMVNINCGGSGASAGSGAGSSPGAPADPTASLEAATADPGELSDAAATPAQKEAKTPDSVTVGGYEPGSSAGGSSSSSSSAAGSSESDAPAGGNSQAEALNQAAESAAPFCERCEEIRREQEQAGGAGS